MDPGADLDLRGMAGFLVADARGRVVGRVEGPDVRLLGKDARRTVCSLQSASLAPPACPGPSDRAIDDRTKVIGLGIDGDAIRAFL